MGSLDHICGTTMPTVDPEQTITWKEAQQKAENCKKGTPKSV